jgi:thiamine-phosphate pyrophosphorylase
MQSEMNRTDLRSILIANYKRGQESSRVLEELYKIVDPVLSERFKQIRYELYTLEKENLLNLNNESH